MLIGFGRSYGDGGAADQLFLRKLGADRVFLSPRPEHDSDVLEEAVGFLRSGDVFAARRFDLIGGSLDSIIWRLDRIYRVGAFLQVSPEEGAPEDALLPVAGYLAEVARNRLTPDAGQTGGKRGRGRPAALSPQHVASARAWLSENRLSVAEIAERLGVSRATIYRLLRRD